MIVDSSDRVLLSEMEIRELLRDKLRGDTRVWSGTPLAKPDVLHNTTSSVVHVRLSLGKGVPELMHRFAIPSGLRTAVYRRHKQLHSEFPSQFSNLSQ